jgi:hypothetical protein
MMGQGGKTMGYLIGFTPNGSKRYTPKSTLITKDALNQIPNIQPRVLVHIIEEPDDISVVTFTYH